MNSKGVRISDKKNRVVCINLHDILEEVQNGDMFHWAILYLHGMGELEEGKTIPDLGDQIRKSKQGFLINWDDLYLLSYKLDDVNIDDVDILAIIIIGCRDPNLLQRYDEDQEMYETCDFVIEKIDSNFWEVFSKDHELINRLAKKFKEIEFLESDFQKDFYKEG